jgi:hypothetical protein
MSPTDEIMLQYDVSCSGVPVDDFNIIQSIRTIHYNPISDVTRRSPTASGSCLAISIMLNNFLIPILRPFASESPPKPACWSICIVCSRSLGFVTRSTSSRMICRERRLETGGTRISESKLSESPRSVRIGRNDVVAMTSSRRPYR